MDKSIDNPLVSIVMPAYNAEIYLEQSIRSVLDQTYQNWELIIVNDGSKDKTKDIAETYVQKDKRILAINQENKRLGGARNTAIKAARGEWIAFLDSDDLWEPQKLELQISTSYTYPEVSVIYTDGYIFYNDNLNNLTPYPTKAGLFKAEQMYKMEYQANYIPVLSVIAKSSLINKIGLQEVRTYFHGCEDWDYWLRMARAGATFLGIKEKLFYYRRHDYNMSSNNLNMDLARTSAFIENFDKKYFEVAEAERIFKPLIMPLIVELLKAERAEDAEFILSGVSKILPFKKYRVLKLLMSFTGIGLYSWIMLLYRFKIKR